MALFTSFVTDFDWLTSHGLASIPLCVVVDCSQNPTESGKVERSGNCCVVYPSSKGKLMHAKIMLLWHDEYIRVVIGTGNLVLTVSLR